MTPTNTPPAPEADGGGDDGATYEFRWDVEVPASERRYGQKFMKQWKRVLQAQRLTPLVSARLCPRQARFQLCVDPDVAGGEAERQTIREHEEQIFEELMHLRRSVPGGPDPEAAPVAGEPAGTHPAGWQGVRVWMTFARRDVEAALAKKPKL
jgi:hypothetical protein